MTTVTRYEYNDFNQLLSQSDDGVEKTFSWPDDILQPTDDGLQVKDIGLVIRVGQHAMTVHEENAEIRQIKNQNGIQIDVDQDGGSQPSSIAYSKGGDSPKAVTYRYDNDGNLIEKRNVTLNKSETYVYENNLKIQSKDMEGRKSWWTYDDYGNVLTEAFITPDNIVASYHYDERGNLLGQRIENELSEFSYDAYGHQSQELKGDKNGVFEVRTYDNDAAGNRVRFTEGEGLRETRFKYDAYNKVTVITEARGLTQVSYDHQTRQQSFVDPAGRNTTLTVNTKGNFTGLLDPHKKEWLAEYTDTDKISWKQRPDGSRVTYTYDTKGLHVREVMEEGVNQRKMCENGNLLYAKNKRVNCHFKYDDSAAHIGYDVTFRSKDPISIRFNVDATGVRKTLHALTQKITDRIYDEENNLISREKEDVYLGVKTNYDRDERGRLTGIRGGKFSIQFEYAPNGKVNKVIRGNQYNSDYSHTATGRIHRSIDSKADETMEQCDYAYDTGGNLIRQRVNTAIHEYTYDGNDQLMSVTDAEGNQEDYQYDPVGNTLQRGENSFQYDEDGVYLLESQQWHFRYDANGYLQEKQSKLNANERHTFRYSSLGQLIEFNRFDASGEHELTAKYSYDALGHRIEKSIEYPSAPDKNYHRLWVYDGDNLLYELSDNFSHCRQYIYAEAIDFPLGFIENGSPYYYLLDVVGNVVGLLDEQGERVASYRYDAFGLLLDQQLVDNAPENCLLFAAREWDAESQTYFLRNRTYDPSIGRFIQPDPYPGNIDHPVTVFNKYIYGANNPLKYRDPHGLFIWLVLGVLLAPILFIAAIALVTIAGYLLSKILPMNIDGWGQNWFTGAIKGIVKGILRPFQLIIGTTLGIIGGVVGTVLGGLYALVTGGNVWEGMKDGWAIGFDTGFFLGSYPFEMVNNIVDWILDYEINHTYNNKLASFLGYCSLVAYLSSREEILKRLPQRYGKPPEENSTTKSEVFKGYELRLMSAASTDDIVNDGRSVVVVALIDAHLHIRILDGSGVKVVDKPESELSDGKALTALKQQLMPFPDESTSLSPDKKQEIIRNAASSADYTPLKDSLVMEPNAYIHKGDTDTQCFIAHNENFILVAFPGTDSTYDAVVTDFLRNLIQRRAWFDTQVAEGVQVADGFYAAYNSVRSDVFSQVNALYTAQSRPIYTTGHSLGGTLAIMAGLDLSDRLSADVTCYTYGSPRAGNLDFADLYNSQIDESQLHQNLFDPVPSVPSSLLGYYHVDTEKTYGSTEYSGHAVSSYLHNIYMEDQKGTFRFLSDIATRNLVIGGDVVEDDLPDISAMTATAEISF